MDSDESETVVEGVLDDTSAIFGPFAKKDGYSISFDISDASPEVVDLLFGTDMRTVKGEVIQSELTDGTEMTS